MLTQLSTIKSRLALEPLDTTQDALLTSLIMAISARFDRETNRTLARTENATFEFSSGDTEILVPCYPVESVVKFEVKSSETEGWVEQPGVEYLVLRGCVISLASELPALQLTTCGLQPVAARVIYTGGYLLPGSSPCPGAIALPADLEQAAVEQTAFCFQTRDMLGVIRQWPKGGNYAQFADLDLLPSVRSVLATHTRLGL
jgi:hypothetical protein